MKSFGILFCLVSTVVLSAVSARANVYATDIKLNGSLYTITNAGSAPVTISYRLNQPATLGVTVAIWQGSNQVATINGGTNMGLNSVVWGGTNNLGANVTSGTYSVTITAGASDVSGGTGNWTQISIDTNAGNYAFDPNGMAVDNNTNSPYYGRVMMGCSFANGAAKNPISKQVIQDGIYKMNADGSLADEGGFGYGGYTRDDAGYTAIGEMPPNSHFVPWRLRIGDDDRIYMLDLSDEGAIVAFDMQVTTNQVVIDDGGADGGGLSGPHNYAQNPDFGDLQFGIGNFDVSSTTTSNAAVWLCDGDVTGNWGIWMYHLVNGQSDTNDIGTQAVTTGGDLSQGSTGGCMIDAHLDIFCGQSETTTNAVYDAMVFTNWSHGVLPGISGGSSFTDGASPGQVEWGFGCGVNAVCTTNPTFEAVQDVVINSRTSPTIVACPMTAGIESTNGIRLLNAVNGAIIQSNIDFGQQYTCAAWDNVGNLYGASPSRKVWRVWSPPGPSTNTTMAVAQLVVTIQFAITGITAVPTSAGCANVTIHFSAVGSPPASAFTLVSSPALNGTFSPVAGAVITGSAGFYQATFSNCSTSFYKMEQSP